MNTRHRRAIERLYKDICTIYRLQKVKNPDTGVTEMTPVAIYENQPCRISQKSLGTNSQTDAQNNIMYETKLFIAPELGLKQGDKIEATRGSTVRKYEAGEPFIYETHQEVSIQRKEWA